MEASYELLGEAHSDEDTSAGGEEFDEDYNGEEVRSEVEFFVRNKLIQTAVAGIGFLIAVTGIWRDGVPETYIVI